MPLLTPNSENQYYQDESNSGNYQFTSLSDIINQFIVAYVGEDKIISSIKRTDIIFHAQRALQEFSFDTFKSVKAHELTVPPSLRLMLPQDYVNYTNISWSDSAGIQHTIYPVSKTSNPQRQGDLIANSQLTEDADGITLDTGWAWSNVVGDNQMGAIEGSSVATGNKISIPVDVKMGQDYLFSFSLKHPWQAASTTLQAGNLKITLYGKEGYKNVYSENTGSVVTPIISEVYLPSTAMVVTDNEFEFNIPLGLKTTDVGFQTTTDTDSFTLVIEPGDSTNAFVGLIDKLRLSQTGASENVNLVSKTWANYRSATPVKNKSRNFEDDTYWKLNNKRYGLDPQYAQINGSFFIDNNILHLSSDLSGKTIVLKYISDSLGTDGEMQVHKMAEEAMYKWIAYAVLSTRANVPNFQIARYKKEKFAEMRKAKLRLSNIKLEEITQIFRGKSKQIKH